jgi:hypothetical protein
MHLSRTLNKVISSATKYYAKETKYMKQRGNISFSRTTTGSYLMKLTDSKGDDFAEVEMSAEEFAASITGKQSKCDLTTFTDT